MSLLTDEEIEALADACRDPSGGVWPHNFSKALQTAWLAKLATKPHVHAELIKAWADGAKIQFKPDTIVNTIVDVKHSWRNVSIRCQWEGDMCPEGYKHNLDHVHVRYVFDGDTGECKDVKLIRK